MLIDDRNLAATFRGNLITHDGIMRWNDNLSLAIASGCTSPQQRVVTTESSTIDFISR